ETYLKLLHELFNIVLIGLPLSGKSKYAKILSKQMDKSLYDTDDKIEDYIEMPIPKYFEENSEASFRKLETKIIREIYKSNNYIISTGGGIIENRINIDLLKQNGIIIFLNKDPEIIAKKEIIGRPLIKKSNDIFKLARKRKPLYIKYSDIIIDINNKAEYHIEELKEKIDEYINNQWPKH
ncbi:MAG: shikimate kinase, partial [Bacillota bacterium]